MKWLSIALTDEYPAYKAGSIVQILPLGEGLAEDTKFLVSWLDSKGFHDFAVIVKNEREKEAT